MRALNVAVVLAVLGTAAGDAMADEAAASGACSRWAAPALFDGPIAVGYGDADVATGRRTCPRTELGFGGRVNAVLDTPDFYGNILALGLLSGSYALSDRQELFGTLELVRYHYVVNAVIEGNSLALGQLTVGGSQLTLAGDSYAGAATARLLVPTSFATGGARVYGAELGHSFTWRSSQKLELHGWAGVDFSAALSAAAPLPTFGGLLNVGVQYSPADWLGLVLDANGRLGPLSYLSPAVAVRFRLTQGLGAELAGTLPLAGTDRHDAIVGLRLAWRP